jgi:hypothetical protein
MLPRHSLLALLLTIALLAPAAPAADLAPLRRPPAKEPTYESGSPRYCLLVFGREATPIWLVVDGNSLYADRDGSGDLTAPAKRKRALTWGGPEGTLFEFGGLTRLDGGKVHLTVCYRGRADEPDAVGITVGGRPYQSAERDAEGLLHFAARPQDAPVIHFGGPLRVVPAGRPVFRRGADGQTLSVRLGSPGLGQGTLALLDTGRVPADRHAVAQIEFPRRVAGAEPPKVRVVLRERC